MKIDKVHQWNEEKNKWLKANRGISFEQVMTMIVEEKVLDIAQNTKSKYDHQKVYVIVIEQYVYLVPFVEDEEKVFLKTIIPSRKATKHYLNTD